MIEEKVVGKIDFGEERHGGEVFFCRRDGVEDSVDEDDGYLMTFLYNHQTKQSEFVMWDAKTMNPVPQVRARCDYRVPHGFHTMFIP